LHVGSRTSGEQYEIEISVRDTGIGLTSEELGRLFRAFSQADVSTTRKYGGTGLGLVISKGLVEKMGGRIRAESQPGAGSTFRFTFIAPAAPPVPVPAESSVSVFDNELAVRHPLQILVAEDNATNQFVVGSLLRRLGYRPDFVENGRLALEAIAQRPYDLVLMDVQMPEMDGITATKNLLARTGQGPRPRIVATTANATEDDCRVCLDAGMDDYLSKPIILEKLKQALFRCPSGRSASIKPAMPAPEVPDSDAARAGGRASAFDPAAVEELRRSVDREDLKVLVGLFASDIESSLRELEEGFSRRDFEKMRRACHSLKGVAASAGAMVLSEAARALEDSIRDEEGERAAESLPLVRRRAEEALAELPLLV